MREVLIALVAAGCGSVPGVVAVRGNLSGSGAAVAEDRVVTAAHLLGAYSPEVLRRVSAGRALTCGSDVLVVRGDVAVLRVARGIGGGVLEVGPALNAGDEARIVDGTVWPAAAIAAEALGADLLRPAGRLDRIGPGLSGAPVVDRNGRLVGIVTGVLVGAAGGPLVVLVPASEFPGG